MVAEIPGNDVVDERRGFSERQGGGIKHQCSKESRLVDAGGPQVKRQVI